MASIGKFYMFIPNVDLVHQYDFYTWKVKGSVLTSAMSDGLFLFRFYLKEDMIKKSILRGPSFFDKGHCNGLSLFKWIPYFDPKIDLGRVVPTWVHLMDLPLEC